ncbi:hypothetical protein QBC39DRAFT_341331 [Podospora conica]|nr:hypothetical protein QBC39DRAFT_341331 [Schizothecium conicum]
MCLPRKRKKKNQTRRRFPFPSSDAHLPPSSHDPLIAEPPRMPSFSPLPRSAFAWKWERESHSTSLSPRAPFPPASRRGLSFLLRGISAQQDVPLIFGLPIHSSIKTMGTWGEAQNPSIQRRRRTLLTGLGEQRAAKPQESHQRGETSELRVMPFNRVSFRYPLHIWLDRDTKYIAPRRTKNRAPRAREVKEGWKGRAVSQQCTVSP